MIIDNNKFFAYYGLNVSPETLAHTTVLRFQHTIELKLNRQWVRKHPLKSRRLIDGVARAAASKNTRSCKVYEYGHPQGIKLLGLKAPPAEKEVIEEITHSGPSGGGTWQGTVRSRSLEALENWAVDYKKEWNPAGYGTTVKIEPMMVGPHFVANVWRSGSC